MSSRIGLWSLGVGLVGAAGLYAAFWLPYRNPAEDPPYPLPILPVPAEPGPGPDQGYKWVDRGAGVVRIPVEDAMAIAAGRLTAEGGAGHHRIESPRPRGPRRNTAPGR